MKSLVDTLYERVSAGLKVPNGPLDPNGETVIRAFKPAPRYAGYRLCRWVPTQISIFIPYAIFLLPAEYKGFLDQIGFGWIQHMNYTGNWQENMPELLKAPVKVITVGGYLLQLSLSLFFTLLSAKSQSYLLTDQSVRIRRGLWFHQQITLSLKNIQQVKYSQNLLERMWGIGSLEVRTAGGGATSKRNKKDEDSSHTGELEGLLDPIELRELVNATIKDASAVKQSQALAPSIRSTVAQTSPELDTAIQELLQACQSLKADIEARKRP